MRNCTLNHVYEYAQLRQVISAGSDWMRLALMAPQRLSKKPLAYLL